MVLHYVLHGSSVLNDDMILVTQVSFTHFRCFSCKKNSVQNKTDVNDWLSVFKLLEPLKYTFIILETLINSLCLTFLASNC